MRAGSSALVVFCGLLLLWLGVTGRYRSLVAAWYVLRDDTGGDLSGGLAGAGVTGAAGTTAGTSAADNFWRGMTGQLPKLPGIGGSSTGSTGATGGSATTPGTNINGGASRPAWGGIATPPINGNGTTGRTLPPVDPAILARIFGK